MKEAEIYGWGDTSLEHTYGTTGIIPIIQLPTPFAITPSFVLSNMVLQL